jgi:hypothetical protein
MHDRREGKPGTTTRASTAQGKARYGRDSHKAFVNDNIIINGLPAATHTIRLEAIYDSAACNTVTEGEFHACTSTNTFNISTPSILKLPG